MKDHAHALGITYNESFKDDTFNNLPDEKVACCTRSASHHCYLMKRQRAIAYLHRASAHRPQWRVSQCMDSQTEERNAIREKHRYYT